MRDTTDSGERQIVEVELRTYIEQFRDEETILSYCKECNSYGANWSCPPFEFDIEEYLAPYGWIYLIVQIAHPSPTHSTANHFTSSADQLFKLNRELRLPFDEELLTIEKSIVGSRALFAGSCLFCSWEKYSSPPPEHYSSTPQICSRTLGEECLHPDLVRPSLEALGFDVARSYSKLFNRELKWSDGHSLPQQLTLIGGLLSKKRVGLNLFM